MQETIENQANQIRSLPDEILVNAFGLILYLRLLALSQTPIEQPEITPESLRYVTCASVS